MRLRAELLDSHDQSVGDPDRVAVGVCDEVVGVVARKDELVCTRPEHLATVGLAQVGQLDVDVGVGAQLVVEVDEFLRASFLRRWS